MKWELIALLILKLKVATVPASYGFCPSIHPTPTDGQSACPLPPLIKTDFCFKSAALCAANFIAMQSVN